VAVATILVGDGFGVDCRSGEGEAGLSGRRNGETLGEPYERGDGLYEADTDMIVPFAVKSHSECRVSQT